MKAAVTVSLTPQAKGGPFVFWNGLEDAFIQASKAGFDAVEIFPPSADAFQPDEVNELCSKYGLKVAAIGTGAGWVVKKWHLCHENPAIREEAFRFISSIIDLAALLGAPAIIGSMQGRVENGISREQALEWLADSLRKLGDRAANKGQILIYEPLNRYETNLFNRLGDASGFLDASGIPSVKLLADLFHMNIEESSLSGALRSASHRIGHVHFADSNRQAMGFGHTDAGAIIRTLQEIGYNGYLSAEILPLPDPVSAALQTIKSLKALLPKT